jgi:hypothetical protein
MAKYKIPVVIQTIASKTIGEVECSSFEEFAEKAADLWESTGFYVPTTNITNDFDLSGDWDVDIVEEDEFKYYEEIK